MLRRGCKGKNRARYRDENSRPIRGDRSLLRRRVSLGAGGGQFAENGLHERHLDGRRVSRMEGSESADRNKLRFFKTRGGAAGLPSPASGSPAAPPRVLRINQLPRVVGSSVKRIESLLLLHVKLPPNAKAATI